MTGLEVGCLLTGVGLVSAGLAIVMLSLRVARLEEIVLNQYETSARD